MLAEGDGIKLYKDGDGKFNHNFSDLPAASQYELLQLEKTTLDLRNRIIIALEIRKQAEGDKTLEP